MKRSFELIIFAIFLFPLLLVSRVAAQEAIDCANDYAVTASALIKLQPSTTKAYVRAGRSDDSRQAKLYYQSASNESDSECQFLGQVMLSTDYWQLIGSLPEGDDIGSLYLTIDSSEPTQAGASQPSVILAGSDIPCDLVEDCSVAYDDAIFELSPRKISLNFDTLRVGVLTPPHTDTIKEIIYSVDGKQVYKKKTLEQFNERYVSGGEHSLERTVVLNSGQTLSDKRYITKGSLADPGYWFTSTVTRYSKIILYLGTFFGAFLLGFIWLQISRFWYRRHMWRITHIAGAQKPAANKKPHVYDGSISVVFKEHKKLFLAPFAALLLIVFSFSCIINVFTVDGISMEPTLHDTSRRLLLLAPAQLGKLNGNGYVPERGSVIVVQKDENNLFNEGIVEEKSYVVKRIVALPEERVVIKDGVINVFNSENEEGFIPDDKFGWISDTTGSEYIKLDVTLKQNELFVVGDNRDNSIDSRYYGPIQASQVVGKVL